MRQGGGDGGEEGRRERKGGQRGRTAQVRPPSRLCQG